MGSSSKQVNEVKKALREAWKSKFPLDPALREMVSLKVCQELIQNPLFKSAHRIAVFCGLSHEINLLPLLELWHRPYAFPKVKPNRELHFFEIESLDSLRPGTLGILEPSIEKNQVMEWTHQDLFLVPGFAFDFNGNRIGTGGGYYDRFFAKNPLPQRWGVCFHQQIHDQELAHTHHDVRMGALVTEEGFFQIRKGE